MEPKLGRDVTHLIGSYLYPDIKVVRKYHDILTKELSDKFCYGCYKYGVKFRQCDCCHHKYCLVCITKLKSRHLWSVKFDLTPNTKLILCPCHHIGLKNTYHRCISKNKTLEICQ